ncbi:hypothetical protein VIGAN_04046000, partial [Vigna angularis var. angularis]
ENVLKNFWITVSRNILKENILTIQDYSFYNNFIHHVLLATKNTLTVWPYLLEFVFTDDIIVGTKHIGVAYVQRFRRKLLRSPLQF